MVNKELNFTLIHLSENFLFSIVNRSYTLIKNLYIYIYIYINNQSLEKVQLDFNWILNLAPRILFNF